MSSIGIVGSGIAGLHLALFLQQEQMPVTLYSDRTPDQILAGRLPNTPARFAHTIERERLLKVNHWETIGFNLQYIDLYVGGESPLSFRGHLSQPASFVDPRPYSATLLEDFQQRGGQVVVGAMTKDDIVRCSTEHALMVIASGGSLTELFERLPEHSPYTRPQRKLWGGYFTGIHRDPNGFNFVISPGHGEIYQGTMYCPDGPQTQLVFAGIPSQAFEPIMEARYMEDPPHFNAIIFELLSNYAPPIFQKIDPTHFSAVGPQHLLQGGITPTVRRAYSLLGNGKFAMAVGDVHVINDPIAGQGANAASHSAFVLGKLILEHTAYDQTFCELAEQRMWEFVRAVTEWSNAFLQPPPPYLIDLLVQATQYQSLADAFVDNFNDPQRQWSILSDPLRTAMFIQQFTSADAETKRFSIDEALG